MIHRGNSGFLKIILGSMFSGKTSELLNIYRLYNLCDISCCVINHSLDKRYHKTLLSSHDNRMIPCISSERIGDLLDEEILKNYQVFLINEGQFFKGLYETVKSLVEKHKKTVYVCGLDGDYQRKQFGEILNLIPLADEIVKKKHCVWGAEMEQREYLPKELPKKLGKQ